MKHIKKVLTIFLVIAIFTTTAFADKVITKNYDIITTKGENPEYLIDEIGKGDTKDIPMMIKEHGKRYEVIKVETIKPEEKVITKSFSNRFEKKINKEIMVNGTKYYLKDVKWEKNFREPMTKKVIYLDESNDIAPPKEIDITNSINNQSITVKGLFLNKEIVAGGGKKPFTVNAKFYGGEDVEYYVLNGTKVPNNPNTPTWQGYEKTILNSLGLNPKIYTITSGTWNGGYKVDKNGEEYRNATFKGVRVTNSWNVYYKEKLTKDSKLAYIYSCKAKYSNLKDNNKIMLTVTYEKTGLSLLTKILIGVGVLVIGAVALSIILMLLRKKTKKAKKAETNNEVEL